MWTPGFTFARLASRIVAIPSSRAMIFSEDQETEMEAGAQAVLEHCAGYRDAIVPLHRACRAGMRGAGAHARRCRPPAVFR